MNQVTSISPISKEGIDDLFITCESFEDRCNGAIARLDSYKTRLCLILSFLSRTRNPRGETKRKMNMSDMLLLLGQKGVGVEPRRVKLDPYNPLDLVLSIQDELSLSRIQLTAASVTVDISCFTKIQLLFLLRFLQTRIECGALRLLYTLPSYYGSLDKKDLAVGYDRLTVAPFENREVGKVGNKGLAMAILLGHEGTRALHAWTELEPDFTILVQATSTGDPEIGNITERRNKMLIGRAREGALDFSLQSCPDMGLREGIELFHLVSEMFAGNHGRRLAFVPMGPKPLVAAFALSTQANGHVPVDIVYPVPRAYDPDYSVGIGATYSYTWSPKQVGRPAPNKG